MQPQQTLHWGHRYYNKTMNIEIDINASNHKRWKYHSTPDDYQFNNAQKAMIINPFMAFILCLFGSILMGVFIVNFILCNGHLERKTNRRLNTVRLSTWDN